jgi:hypothetical protein
LTREHTALNSAFDRRKRDAVPDLPHVREKPTPATLKGAWLLFQNEEDSGTGPEIRGISFTRRHFSAKLSIFKFEKLMVS